MASVSFKPANGLGIGCLALFALPFAGFGLFAAGKAILEIGAGKWKSGLPLLVFGLVFSAVGFGLIAFARFGSKKAKQEQASKEAHPDQPWLWREDWARGEVKSASKGAMVFTWIFALIWNAISSGAFFATRGEIKAKPFAFLVLVFPAIGVLLLIWAIRQTLRWNRFGESFLKLTTVPGIIGGALAGVIHTSRRLDRATEVRLRLACLERDTSGDSTSEHLQWEDEKLFSGDVLQGGGIPVVFDIPFDGKPTAALSASRSVVWRLDARAKVPGTDYIAQFEVPVFKTEQSRPDAPKLPDPAAVYEKTVASVPPPGITIRPAGDGIQFHFAAARNTGAAAGLTLFTALWTGAVVLMLKLKAPIFLPIIFGFFGVLMVLGIIGMWTGASSVVASLAGLNVTKWYCFIHWKKFVAAADVQSLDAKLGMSHGSTTYYDLIAVTTAGNKVKLASSIRGKKESEWLVREMLNALGRK
jgi:hypothetical protein